MAAPLVICTKEQRAVIRFLQFEGESSDDILHTVGRKCFVTKKSVWTQKFKEGPTGVSHKEGAARRF